jgi:hypothetical protein
MKRSKRMVYAAAGSGIWIALVLVYVFLNLEELGKMPPNAWGDFFAGVSAPLAFLWLVVGYFQQGEELRFQAEQLRLQVEESKNLVQQATRQAEASAALLEVEREKHQEEMRRGLVAAQPNFQIVHQSTTGNTKVLQVRNIGAIAPEFRVTAGRGLLKVYTPAKGVASGETIQIDCTIDGRFPWEFEAQLDYADAAFYPRKGQITCIGDSVNVRMEGVVVEQLY